MSNQNYAGYGAFYSLKKEKNKKIEKAIISRSLENVENSISGIKNGDNVIQANDEKDLDIIIDGDVAQGIWHFYLSLKSFYELSFFCDEVPAAFTSSYFKSNIVQYANKNFDVLKTLDDENNELKIYGINEAYISTINRKIDRWKEIHRGFERLPSALILS